MGEHQLSARGAVERKVGIGAAHHEGAVARFGRMNQLQIEIIDAK